MKILVACEESQRVCIEFRKLGHEAYSCDLSYCSGGHPEWHIWEDVHDYLNGHISFRTCDGVVHYIPGKWDMIIAFPPCTYLTKAGNRSFSLKCNSYEAVTSRLAKRFSAAEFFLKIASADCDKIVIENPVGVMSSFYRKPDQIIQPYFFGDDAIKTTCLWLKGVPGLKPTKMLPKPEPLYVSPAGKNIYFVEGMKGSGENRAKERSKTFPGIAAAMASQWG